MQTTAARNLANTTKTRALMLDRSPRWLMRMLPWVDIEAGVYRVNRRAYSVGDGKISVARRDGDDLCVIPEDLRELDIFRRAPATDLEQVAERFIPRQIRTGEDIVSAGTPAAALHVIAEGKATRWATLRGRQVRTGLLSRGDHFDSTALTEDDGEWPYAITAAADTTVLTLTREAFTDLLGRSPALRDCVEQSRSPGIAPPREQATTAAAGHHGTPDLPYSFVDYEERPREYELELVQTNLRVHTRVSDLYSSPYDLREDQVRLTVESLREVQESELLNNPRFGLLHNAAPAMRIATRTGPPTPDDLDELFGMVWKEPAFYLAHPRAIAAFGRECTRRGVPPATACLFGNTFLTWRGLPLVPSDKIPVDDWGRTSILLLRVGEEAQGVIGLRPEAVPDQREPGVSIRFNGIDAQGVSSHLVTAYFSAAVLVEDALAVLEDVEVCHYHDYD